MSDKPPWDPVKACFYLVAGILTFQCVVVLIGVLFCIYWSPEIVEGKYKCESLGQMLNELLTMALASALAFAGGFTKKDK
jgi:hypothetical protein